MVAKIKDGEKQSMNEYILNLVRNDVDGIHVGPLRDWEEIPGGPDYTESPRVMAAMESTSSGIGDYRKLSPQELAAKLGVKTGKTIDEVEPRVLTGVATQEVHQPSRNWGKFYSEMNKMEPLEAQYAFEQATAAITLPIGFRMKPDSKQIWWLNNNA